MSDDTSDVLLTAMFASSAFRTVCRPRGNYEKADDEYYYYCYYGFHFCPRLLSHPVKVRSQVAGVVTLLPLGGTSSSSTRGSDLSVEGHSEERGRRGWTPPRRQGVVEGERGLVSRVDLRGFRVEGPETGRSEIHPHSPRVLRHKRYVTSTKRAGPSEPFMTG